MQNSRLTQVKFKLGRVEFGGQRPNSEIQEIRCLSPDSPIAPVCLRIMHDVIVIGGGVIGLSIARELASRKSVLLLDRAPTGQGTSHAAAGMLTPLSEADDQGPFFVLCRISLGLYDRFLVDLQQVSGLDLTFSTESLVSIASSEE